MLRIKLEMEPAFNDRAEALVRIAPVLRDLGLEVGADLANPDATFIHESVLLEESKRGVIRSEPLIVFERQASATLGVNAFTRNLIQQPHVLGWVKEHALRDPALHNAPLYVGRYHNGLMAPEAPESEYRRPIQISDADLQKIGLAAPHYLNPMFDVGRAMRCRTLNYRHANIMYTGTVKYDFEPLERHRMQCCQTIQDLSCGRKIIGIGRAFQPRFFNDVLRDTKIFVSPYGWGEYSWKDYEAIYAGCVLIKPRSSFVESFGFDIFEKDRFCLECEPDFSDLEDVVNEVLSREAHYIEFAQAARDALMAAGEPENWAPKTVAYFERTMARVAA